MKFLVIFDYFPFIQSNGFNILTHGVGSKKKMLEKFCETYLHNAYYIQLLGYHHDLNPKNVSIVEQSKEMNFEYLEYKLLYLSY